MLWGSECAGARMDQLSQDIHGHGGERWVIQETGEIPALGPGVESPVVIDMQPRHVRSHNKQAPQDKNLQFAGHSIPS